MQKTVLVTGAGGFIGLNVVKEYSGYGWRVLALVHNKMPEELNHSLHSDSLVSSTRTSPIAMFILSLWDMTGLYLTFPGLRARRQM